MLFSSLVFLYTFLPITLIGYYLSPRGIKNYWLLAASLIFFAWGGVSFTSILLTSIIVNYLFGLIIQRSLQTRWARWWLFAGVTFNIVLLGLYKYAGFIVFNTNAFLAEFTWRRLPPIDYILPIGISFYTFHSLSYLVDIYRGKTTAQKNLFDLALYIAMFSQLIAGPIIRYSDVWQQLRNREHNISKFSSGIERFLIGLSRKVLLANTFARIADQIFNHYIDQLNAPIAWLGIVCYTLQIYYDFAGYSDMAIGLGRMFGFEFMENFNFPYMARSVKEFWRRWHISLSTFFRDYVYIPLGGNRVKPWRAYVNLIIVFFLTGLWHGAKWNFILWGLFHGFFMLLERLGFEKLLEKAWKPIANIYTILVVMFAWVLFRAESPGVALEGSLEPALMYWEGMFCFHSSPEQMSIFMGYMTPELFTCLGISIAGAFGVFKPLENLGTNLIATKNSWVNAMGYTYHIIRTLGYCCLLYLCSIYLVSGTYNPFIYFRF
jgi:alginate O-acetyltransferase complex protein AlgI